MSMNFVNPVNDAALTEIVKEFGPPVATDRKTFLFDRMNKLEQRAMKRIANAAKQPATVEIHAEGDIKIMSDGTRYQVTPTGWKRLDEPTPAPA